MKTTIMSQEKNPFLEREEFMISITTDSAPTKDAIISDLGKDASLTIVRKINANFGKKEFTADVIVYDSLDAKEKNMVIPQKIRKKMEADAKAKLEEEKKQKEAEAKAAEEAEATAKEAKASDEGASEEKVEEQVEAKVAPENTPAEESKEKSE